MRDGELTVAAGKSQSGKTFLTAAAVKSDKSLLVWDAKGEFARKFTCHTIVDVAQLHRIATQGLSGRYACPWPVTAKNFDKFCRLAWVWIRVCAAKGRCVSLVVEELADVTPPGKAPAAWGEILRKSLELGPHIYALTQRPAESDKTTVGNATILRCHSMRRANDRKSMALDMDVDQKLIDGLDFDRKEWLELNDRKRQLRRGGKGQKTRKVAQISRT